ncbi:MAG: hypothetical protein NDI84_03025 [Steroidobacteraceae bacterium]|nr:hypothetical protein [Steroidobacteraceae bacterium]
MDPVAEPKRKRGRPPKNANKPPVEVNPAATAAVAKPPRSRKVAEVPSERLYKPISCPAPSTDPSTEKCGDVARRPPHRPNSAQGTLPFSAGQTTPVAAPERPRVLDLTRQLRNLLLLRPLFEFALKIRRTEEGDGLYEGLDAQYLALALLDFIMEGGALGRGRSRVETINHIGEVVRRMKPAISDFDARRVGQELLDALHNQAGLFHPFEYTYFDAGTETVQPFRFSLLRYERAEDESSYYRVTDEGFLVYLGMLDLGAANMQEFMDKLLHELIRRGRVDDAVQVSNQAYRQALRFFEHIRTQLESAIRTPARVSWPADIEPVLKNSREHLNARTTEQHSLLDVVTSKLSDSVADPAARANLAHLSERLQQEQRVGASLDTLLAAAANRYMRAQTANFRARPKQRMPDLDQVVLRELMQLDVTTLAEAGDRMGHHLIGAETPRLFDFNLLFKRLLETSVDDVAVPEDSGERMSIDDIPPHFTAEDHREAEAFLAEFFAAHAETDIVSVLAAAEAAGIGARSISLMVFRMYQGYSRKESRYPVSTRAEGRFDHRLVTGSKLVFTRDEDTE